MRDRIFISYRRDDARDAAGRIYERLARRFGRRRLFMDVDDIERGVDFRAVLDRHLAETRVLLVVIGPGWLDLRDAQGARRLDDPQDFVRIEVADALISAADVLPVLVGGARMPRPEDLPEDIADLAYRQNIELRGDYFGHDARLLEAIVAEKLKRARGWSRGTIAAATGAVLLSGGVGLWLAVGGVPSGLAPAFEAPAPDAGRVAAPDRASSLVQDTDQQTDQERATPEPRAADQPREDARTAWLRVRASDDIRAIEAFRDAHPGSIYDEAAAAYLADLWGGVWAPVRDGRDADAIADFRARYPSSPFDAEAAGLIEALRAEAAAAAAAERALRKAAQTELRRLELYAGPLDGEWGPRSTEALRRFEAAVGRPEDGAITADDLAALKNTIDLPGATFRDCPECPEMVALPGGSFTMGSPETEPGRNDDEGPQRG